MDYQLVMYSIQLGLGQGKYFSGAEEIVASLGQGQTGAIRQQLPLKDSVLFTLIAHLGEPTGDALTFLIHLYHVLLQTEHFLKQVATISAIAYMIRIVS